jgi:hypothetical protein
MKESSQRVVPYGCKGKSEEKRKKGIDEGAHYIRRDRSFKISLVLKVSNKNRGAVVNTNNS